MEGFSNYDSEEPFEPFTVMLFKGQHHHQGRDAGDGELARQPSGRRRPLCRGLAGEQRETPLQMAPNFADCLSQMRDRTLAPATVIGNP